MCPFAIFGDRYYSKSKYMLNERQHSNKGRYLLGGSVVEVLCSSPGGRRHLAWLSSTRSCLIWTRKFWYSIDLILNTKTSVLSRKCTFGELTGMGRNSKLGQTVEGRGKKLLWNYYETKKRRRRKDKAWMIGYGFKDGEMPLPTPPPPSQQTYRKPQELLETDRNYRE